MVKLLGEDIFPIQGFRDFGPLTEAEQERLLSWEEYFGIDDYKDTWSQAEMIGTGMSTMMAMACSRSPDVDVGDLVTECKEALTEILTDPLTVFYAMQHVLWYIST